MKRKGWFKLVKILMDYEKKFDGVFYEFVGYDISCFLSCLSFLVWEVDGWIKWFWVICNGIFFFVRYNLFEMFIREERVSLFLLFFLLSCSRYVVM